MTSELLGKSRPFVVAVVIILKSGPLIAGNAELSPQRLPYRLAATTERDLLPL
ncbi:hypothetical protein KQY30_03830 [Streptomyces sp. GMY02]|uniref:hypothetical protein n=1 Tax=Streptomyces sp. GMY02 TaxID=1333528 RepID=UPI001C2C37F5|nr:hypothetical protein [Streptomyces sp. GMY02]QXE33547.1 hypothetical protein KQY30_03830 [Streptomyces sp. GMY02]